MHLFTPETENIESPLVWNR